MNGARAAAAGLSEQDTATAAPAAVPTESMDTSTAAEDASTADSKVTTAMLPDVDKKDLIVPPPALKSIVEVTVDYVIRNGMTFEGELRKRQQNNRKFDFLIPGNPYYKWYKWKLQCKINPKAAEEAKKMEEEEQAKQEEDLRGKKRGGQESA